MTLTIIGIILFLTALIFMIVGILKSNPTIIAIAAFINLCACTLSYIEPNVPSDNPEKQHEKLLNNLSEAQKELENFYVDNPSFKHIEVFD